MSSDDGEALMKRAQGGDRDAFHLIIGKYQERVRRVSWLLLHDSSAADDVTQETFTRGLERIKAYRGGTDPSGWFYAIALNLCRENFRKAKRREDRAATKVLESGRRRGFHPRGILTSLVRKETRMKLAIALGFLTAGQREAFVLHYVEELPYEVISSIIGLSPGAARALSHRAKEVLRTKLGDDVIS